MRAEAVRPLVAGFRVAVLLAHGLGLEAPIEPGVDAVVRVPLAQALLANLDGGEGCAPAVPPVVETHLLDPGHGEGVHPRQGGEHLLTGQDEGALARSDPPRRAAPILTPLGTPPQLARAAGVPQEAALLQLAHHLR